MTFPLFPDQLKHLQLQLVIEPGRSIIGDSGYLLMKALYTKSTPEKNFIVVDAAMNDLLRPSLYDAYHEIAPVRKAESGSEAVVEVVGPVCETGDILGESRFLPFHETRGHLFVVIP